MRSSKRDRIIDAAVALVGHRGVEALTYEALAEAADLSKSGIIYHFPSRHELLLGIHTHLADTWEAELVDAAGGPADEVDEAARLRAVVVTMGATAPRAELLMLLDAAGHPDFAAVWERVERAWLPAPADAADSEHAVAAYLVQLMADGLWLHDHVHDTPLPPQVRESLIEAVLARIPRG